MGWFSNSKKKAQQEAEKAAFEAIQAEVEQLKALNSEAASRHSELESSLDAANNERDAIQAEMEAALSSEKQRGHHAISELNRRHEELTGNFAQSQNKIQLLDQANLTMAEMLKTREADVAERDQQIQGLQKEIDAWSEKAETLTKELMAAKKAAADKLQDANRAATMAADLEQQLKSAQSSSASKIAQLQQALANSEARSENRAEQRSALLRNMVEIHRLSMTQSKTEMPPDTLKMVTTEKENLLNSKTIATDSDTMKPSPFFARSASRKEKSDSDIVK